jgi:hypothetical protein
MRHTTGSSGGAGLQPPATGYLAGRGTQDEGGRDVAPPARGSTPPPYDVKRQRKELYTAQAGVFTLVDVPLLHFLVVDGAGDPNTSADYADAVSALYSASYAVRAAARAELGRVHVVGPLEGLWSAEDLDAFRTRDKHAWRWTLMIVQPDWTTPALVEAALAAVRRPGPALGRVRFEPYEEGRSVQVLHVGSYDDEGPVLARLHDEHLPAHAWCRPGRHHEVYLSDPRRVEPARLRTILRQPVGPAAGDGPARGRPAPCPGSGRRRCCGWRPAGGAAGPSVSSTASPCTVAQAAAAASGVAARAARRCHQRVDAALEQRERVGVRRAAPVVPGRHLEQPRLVQDVVDVGLPDARKRPRATATASGDGSTAAIAAWMRSASSRRPTSPAATSSSSSPPGKCR